MIEKSFRWQQAAVSIAVAALGLSLSGAHALSLGRISVQSALGEPLRAEIDVPVISAEEGASLVVTIAPPAAFGAAGMEYNAALASAQIRLSKRSDGRSYLSLSSDRPVNDAFVDIILEATWASGRIVRDFTLLLDPPNLRQANQQPPASSQLPAIASVPRNNGGSAPAAAVPEATNTPAPEIPGSVKNPSVGRVAIPAKPAVVPPAAPESSTRPAQVKVKPGDTAGQIAAAYKPANVSLDQMLVALLRSNPQAFIDNDPNRIKAGALLQLPAVDAGEPGAVPKTLLAQSKDFNEYRGKVAANAPPAVQVPLDRQASGKVQAKVQDEKSAGATPDKLTLSKGAVQASNGEAELARQRSLKEASDRAAALARNIEELSKLKTTPGEAAPNAGMAAGAAAGTGAASAPAPTGTTVAAVTAPAALTPASAPKAAASAPVGASDEGLLASLSADPAAPLWAGALIALLAMLGVYRARQRKKTEETEEPSFLASRLQPDSFFAAPIDEPASPPEDLATGSSLLNPSSLAKAALETDPLAEAEVYLAYGREGQAEEVLREALRVRPELPGIHQKLLEILAKRRDVEGFNAIAHEVQTLTAGQGTEWDRVKDLGAIVDPSNPMYQEHAPSMTHDLPTQVDVLPALPDGSPATAGPGVELDIDLDLDFSLDETPPKSPASSDAPLADIDHNLSDQEAPLSEPTSEHIFEPISEPLTEPLSEPVAQPVPEVEPHLEPEIEFDLDLSSPETQGDSDAPDPAAAEPVNALPDLQFDLGDLALQSPSTEPDQAAKSEGDDGPITNPGALEFDFGSLSLELDKTEPVVDAPLAPQEEDPLVTKLALADEFAAIGDEQGARALIEEVIAQASGELQTRAQQALKKL